MMSFGIKTHLRQVFDKKFHSFSVLYFKMVTIQPFKVSGNDVNFAMALILCIQRLIMTLITLMILQSS